MNHRYFFLLLLLVAMACKEVPPAIDPPAPEPESPLEFLLGGPVDSLRLDAEIPGLALGIVRGEDLLYEGYFGVAENGTEIPIDQNSRFTAGPVSHMITAMAVLQLADESKLDLDVHVGNYLDWDFRHPVFPNATISLRMLLSHVGTVKDDSALLSGLVAPGDAPDNLNGFLSDYFRQAGALYSPDHFINDRPGKIYEFSGTGIALAALVVESVEGVPFSVWCETNLFARLGFASDGWFLDNLVPDDIVLPHASLNGDISTQSAYGYPHYPAGLLRVNLRSASRLWRSLALKGAYGGQRFFGEPQFNALSAVSFPIASELQALGWQKRDVAGSPLWYSGGSEIGFTSAAYLDPATSTGVVIFANISGKESELESLGLTALNAADAVQ